MELENVRLARIKQWVELMNQRDEAERIHRSLTPDFHASIREAEEAITEAWQRLGDHQRSHATPAERKTMVDAHIDTT
jgi:vacuolar-type H+-ATPase subunit E/Vma4